MGDRPTRRDVRRTYESIAIHFSKTRRYAWPEVEAFVQGRSGSLALDVGCGNGRHAELLAGSADRVVGLDVTRGLLVEARRRLREAGQSEVVELVQGDATTLPLAPSRVDLAVYIATIHHLPSRADRVESLRELARVLTGNGRALVSAWSTAADRFEADAAEEMGFDTTLDWTRTNGETVPRFYHIYAPAEFEADVERAGLELLDFEISSGNCYGVVTPEGKRP